MTILKRRTKLVSFRVSEEEYEEIQSACLADGTRSISAFARGALQRTANARLKPAQPELAWQPESGIAHQTQELIDTMRELTQQLGSLTSLMRSSR